MARAFGIVGHACARGVKSLRRKAKRMYYVERVRECERVFKPRRNTRYGRFSRRPCALFASLGAAALSRTHHSQRGLHGVEAAFTLSVFSFVLAPGSYIAFFSSLPSPL